MTFTDMERQTLAGFKPASVNTYRLSHMRHRAVAPRFFFVSGKHLASAPQWFSICYTAHTDNDNFSCCCYCIFYISCLSCLRGLQPPWN